MRCLLFFYAVCSTRYCQTGTAAAERHPSPRQHSLPTFCGNTICTTAAARCWAVYIDVRSQFSTQKAPTYYCCRLGERLVLWDQWHDRQGVVVASCLEKTPTATVNIQCRTCRKDRHRLAYCCYNSSIRVGSNSSRHARNHYVPCYVPVVEC